MIFSAIEALAAYAPDKGLTDKSEIIYTRNRLLEQPDSGALLPDILKTLTDFAVQKGLCADTSESRDIFDTRLMNCLTPRPGEVNRRFFELYKNSPQAATDWFYGFGGDTNYIDGSTLQGIDGNIDKDIVYKDYSYIKNRGMNGFASASGTNVKVTKDKDIFLNRAKTYISIRLEKILKEIYLGQQAQSKLKKYQNL